MTRLRWILVFVLCGCDGRRGEGTPEVHVAYVNGAWNLLPLRLAYGLGYFQEEGVRITPVGFPGTSKVMEALVGGSVEVAATATENLVQLAAEGRAFPGFVNLFSGHALALVVSPKSSKPIHRIADLRGAILGVAAIGSQNHMLANYLLDTHGLKTDAVSTVAIGVGATSLASIERGTVDAGFMTYAGYLVLKQRYPDLTALFDPVLSKEYRYPSAAICARSEWLGRNVDTALRISRAVVRALRYIRETPAEEIVKSLPADLSLDANENLEALRKVIPLYSPDGKFPDDSFEMVKKVVAVTSPKVRTTNIDADAVYTNAFVTGAK